MSENSRSSAVGRRIDLSNKKPGSYPGFSKEKGYENVVLCFDVFIIRSQPEIKPK